MILRKNLKKATLEAVGYFGYGEKERVKGTIDFNLPIGVYIVASTGYGSSSNKVIDKFLFSSGSHIEGNTRFSLKPDMTHDTLVSKIKSGIAHIILCYEDEGWVNDKYERASSWGLDPITEELLDKCAFERPTFIKKKNKKLRKEEAQRQNWNNMYKFTLDEDVDRFIQHIEDYKIGSYQYHKINEYSPEELIEAVKQKLKNDGKPIPEFKPISDHVLKSRILLEYSLLKDPTDDPKFKQYLKLREELFLKYEHNLFIKEHDYFTNFKYKHSDKYWEAQNQLGWM